MTNAEILRHVDHTLLQAVATWDEIKTLCDEAVVRKREIFPIERGSGMHYIYLPALRKYMNHPNHNCLNKLY